MALKRDSVVPSDAVALSEFDALGYVWDTVLNWDRLSESWALRHGATILGGLSALSGIFINRHYRWKFRLDKFGFLATTAPMVLMPGILTTILHRQTVTCDIMMKNNCPICYEVRSMVIQVGFGILYPMVLGPFSTIMLAHRYSTFRVPYLTEGPRVMFKFVKHHTKSFSGILTYLLAAQLIGSATVAYYEVKNHVQIQTKLNEIEEMLLKKRNERSNT